MCGWETDKARNETPKVESWLRAHGTAFPVKSFLFYNLFEIFHLKSSGKLWGGRKDWRSPRTRDGEKSLSWPRGRDGAEITGLERCPHFHNGREDFINGLASLRLQGPAQGVLLLWQG